MKKPVVQSDYRAPTAFGINSIWKNLAVGGYHGLAIRDDNSMVAWGQNEHGQLGIGNTKDSMQPVQVGGDTDWLHVAAGRHHTLAIKTTGSLWAWGSNQYGQLGNGQKRYGPRMVLSP